MRSIACKQCKEIGTEILCLIEALNEIWKTELFTIYSVIYDDDDDNNHNIDNDNNDTNNN